MEMIENPMILPEYEYKEEIPFEVWAEKADADYEDSIFEEED